MPGPPARGTCCFPRCATPPTHSPGSTPAKHAGRPSRAAGGGRGRLLAGLVWPFHRLRRRNLWLASPTPMPGSTRLTSPCARPASPAAPPSPPPGAGIVCCRRPSPAGAPTPAGAPIGTTRRSMPWPTATAPSRRPGARPGAAPARGRAGAKPFATVADAEAMLGGFGTGPIDAMRFVDWRETFAPAPVPRRRFGSREGQGGTEAAGAAARGPGGGRLDKSRHRR
jgi:hypothetical protein